MTTSQTVSSKSPKLRFSEFSEDWQKIKLGDIGPVSMCKRIFKDETSSTEGVPFYKIGTFGKEPDAFISQEKFKEYKSKYSFPNKGDILISAAGTIGRIVIFDGAPSYFQDSNIVWVANNEKTVANSFLKFIYKNIRWTTEDTTIARLYNANIKSKIFWAPSLPEQEKIAAFLGAVDDKIAQLSRKKDLLEQYKKGCMQKLFSQEIRFKQDDGNDFPDWENVKLGEIVSFKKGKGIAKSDLTEKGKNPVIHYGQLFTKYNEIINEVISTTNISLVEAVLSEANDILMPTSDVTPNGLATASAIDLEDVILGGDVLIMRGKRMLNSFFSYWVGANKVKVMRLVSGVTVYHIYGSDLAALGINLPVKDEQIKIVNFLSAIDAKIDLVASEIDHTKAFKKGLLQQMFV